MVKYFFLFAFLTLSSFSFATDDNDAQLKKEFGQELTNVPYFLKYSFSKQFNKDWAKSYYIERKIFLKGYETDLAAHKVQEKEEAKAEINEANERLREKRDADRKLKNRLKAEQEEKIADEKANEDRQNDFNKSLADQQSEIRQEAAHVSH